MPASSLLLIILAALAGRLAFSQCAADPATQKVLDAYAAIDQGADAEKKAARSQILDKALAASPTDFFLLDRQRDLLNDNTVAGREASLTHFAALHQKYPDSPAVTAVYADVLSHKDSAQALKLLEASEKAHPEFPGTHVKLFALFEGSKLQNKQRLGEEIDAYLKVCPQTPSSFVYRVLLAAGSTEQIARIAPALRTRLETNAGAPNQALWTALWDLEFRAVPPTGHAALRQRIAQDLARLEQAQHPDKLAWLSFLRQGYTKANDKAAADRIGDQIVQDYPASREAESLVTDRWRDGHPFPKGNDKEALQAWYRASAAAARDWYERWPSRASYWLMQEFTAASALEDTEPDDLLKLAEKYVRAYHASPNSFYGAQPIEFQVADSLIAKKVLPATIPDWIDQGYYREINRPSRLLGAVRDELTDQQRAMADASLDSMRIERARVLLDYYDAVGQRAKSRVVEDQVAGLHPSDERQKPALFEVRAKAAEMDNRKLDALMFYQAARALGGKQGPRGTNDAAALDRKIAALWKDLGGTEPSFAVFTGQTKLEQVSSVRWERPRHPLPAFTLTDLGGKTWKLADWNGKAVLLNVWATWCGPCRAEHPEFQKLYEMLKRRTDIVVLSLNVDDDAALVAPYMAEFHYSFPVVFGKEVLTAVAGESGVAIPQNWFVAPTGKLAWTQFGYGAEPDWQRIIIGKLEELLKTE